MQKIKLGAVSYLNTKPLIYGFQQGIMSNSLDLVLDYPARIARMLCEDEIDIGLVPVAVLPLLSNPFIVGDCCIGCDGRVASVGLFSDVPVHDIKTVLLDYQSSTSVQLAKILLKEYWKIEPVLLETSEDFGSRIKGTTAGIVIGDRAFQQRKISSYVYDLGEAWKLHTGLPFVFACWISNKPLDTEFVYRFNEATSMGLEHLDEIIQHTPYSLYHLQDYFTHNISYRLTSDKRKGMELFLEKIKQYQL
jgi:chorismate dehydratase